MLAAPLTSLFTRSPARVSMHGEQVGTGRALECVLGRRDSAAELSSTATTGSGAAALAEQRRLVKREHRTTRTASPRWLREPTETNGIC